MYKSLSANGVKLVLAIVLLIAMAFTSKAMGRSDLDYRDIHGAILGGTQLPSQEQMERIRGVQKLPSDEQIQQQVSVQERSIDRALEQVGKPNAAHKHFKGAASAEDRAAYAQGLQRAQGAVAQQVDSAQQDKKTLPGVFDGRMSDKLQQLLQQQESIKKALSRQLQSGTISVPEEALLVFVSFSMPEQMLRNLAEQARTAGAIIVLRGMSEGRLSTTQERARLVNQAGASWEINPELFTTFDVKTVPAFVLTGNKDVIDAGCAVNTSGQCSPKNTFSKVSGDISLKLALETMRLRTEVPFIRDLAEKRLRHFTDDNG